MERGVVLLHLRKDVYRFVFIDNKLLCFLRLGLHKGLHKEVTNHSLFFLLIDIIGFTSLLFLKLITLIV